MGRGFAQAALALLILAGGIYLLQNSPVGLQPDTSEPDSLPGSYLRDVRLSLYDVNGALRDVLSAREVDYFSDRGARSELVEPRFYSHDGDLKTWSASAREGEMFHRAEVLKLRGDVTLIQDEYGSTMKSQAMTLQVAEKIAFSNVPVTITRGESVLRGGQMRANLKDERFRLSNQVETVYVQE